MPKKMKFAEFFFRQGEALEQGKNSIGLHTLVEKRPKFSSEKMRALKKCEKKIIKIRKIAQKQFTKEKNTNII